MSETEMTPEAALVRLRQYQERTAPTWSTASYGGSSAEVTLAEIGRVLAAEVETLRARVEELVRQRDDLLVEDALAERAREGEEPLVVSRFDTAIEPAPEEEPVLTIGAIAEEGRPVALLLDVESRAKVAAWLSIPAPRPASSKERRLEQLLDTIRQHGGTWTTQRVIEFRRRHGHAPNRATARQDLAELHRRGHLTQHGPANGRFYLLATRKDGRR
ncbi:hypothetical protein [Streptomyces silvensis]|uniref:Uncharacterized protein n=1 Tax=Streptomyces silvensis TaxID=1765722 RepID=A0A0W7X655_9ACTN|nr:hypothetical protein [Streptomyces silvensis]KUF18414.1 hypothetical protein AT728_18875 [Streptomyces silvensis]